MRLVGGRLPDIGQHTFLPTLSTLDPLGNGRRRLQGVLVVDATLFVEPGMFCQVQFCYNTDVVERESRRFTECTLFEINDQCPLKNVFDSYSLESDESLPFFDLNSTADSERWAPHLGTTIDKNYLGPWPECVGMSGEAARDFIRSQNPDLSTKLLGPEIKRMTLDRRPSRVRIKVDWQGNVVSAPSRG